MDPGFLKKGGGGGHKIMDACCLLKEDKLIVPPKQKVGGGQTFLLLLLLCLVPFPPYLEELPMNISFPVQKKRTSYIFIFLRTTL